MSNGNVNDNVENELNAEFDSVSEQVVPEPDAAKVGDNIDAEVVAAPVKEIDPEDDRDNWPSIYIEMEDDRPNYEFLSVHGTKKDGSPFTHDLQVMRGVDVQVPPSVVNMLKEAVSAHYTPKKDPQTGKLMLERHDRSSIPWRLVNGGKYI